MALLPPTLRSVSDVQCRRGQKSVALICRDANAGHASRRAHAVLYFMPCRSRLVSEAQLASEHISSTLLQRAKLTHVRAVRTLMGSISRMPVQPVRSSDFSPWHDARKVALDGLMQPCKLSEVRDVQAERAAGGTHCTSCADSDCLAYSTQPEGQCWSPRRSLRGVIS